MGNFDELTGIETEDTEVLSVSETIQKENKARVMARIAECHYWAELDAWHREHYGTSDWFVMSQEVCQ